MIFEVRKGRECSATLTASLERITALQILNHSQGQLIELRGREVANLKELDHNWSLRMDNQADLFFIEKSKLKEQKRKWLKIALSEAGLIAVLLVLLL